jgi:tRNA-dihydrouridine synthase
MAHRAPEGAELAALVVEHLSRSIAFHGERHGVLIFRKHLGAYIEAACWPEILDARRAVRARLCRLESQGEIAAALYQLWAEPRRVAA